MTTTHNPRPPAWTARLVLACIASAVAAAILLAGCGSGAERPVGPAAATAVTDSAGPAAATPGTTDPAAATSAAQSAAAVPTATGVTAAGHPAAAAPSAPTPSAARTDTGPDLGDIDRVLADLDHQQSDADHDAATPEGDIR